MIKYSIVSVIQYAALLRMLVSVKKLIGNYSIGYISGKNDISTKLMCQSFGLFGDGHKQISH